MKLCVKKSLLSKKTIIQAFIIKVNNKKHEDQ